MRRVRVWQLAMIVVPVAALEALCRLGVITPLTMPPPSRIVWDLLRLLASGRMNAALAKTLLNVVMALVLSLVAGIGAGVVIHRMPRLHRVLQPLFATYYAIPVYAFYPLLIVVFGLGDAPEVLIGCMLALVAVVVSTLNGLDSVPKVMMRTARIHRMGTVATSLRITLPYALPYLFTGAKLAVAYAFIGVIGAEFIMSQNGLGFEIRDSYDNFDNSIMYPLILLVLLFAVVVNLRLDRWEKILMARRRRS